MAKEWSSAGHPPSAAEVTVQTSVVVPMFNEAEAVIPLRDRLLPVARVLSNRGGVELLFVDDGSTDRTRALVADAFQDVEDITVRILQHTENRGVGAAIATGFRSTNGDIVCVIDSDCTYDPGDLPDLIDWLIAEDADIVTASPYHPDGRVEGCPAWRIALSKLASRAYRVVSQAQLHCYTSMFRAYRREWANPELSCSMGFVAVAEHLLVAAEAGARIVEYPATLRSRVYGVSKMRTISVASSHMRLIAMYLFRRASGARADQSVSMTVDGAQQCDRACDFGATMRTIESADTPTDAGTE